MNDESYQVLESDTGFEAMKLAQDVLPDQLTQLEWKLIAVDKMLKMNKLKYEHCSNFDNNAASNWELLKLKVQSLSQTRTCFRHVQAQ